MASSETLSFLQPFQIKNTGSYGFFCGILGFRINFWSKCNTNFHLIQYNCSLLQQSNFKCDDLTTVQKKNLQLKVQYRNFYQEKPMTAEKNCRKALTAKM